MASPQSDMTTSRCSLIICGKQEAVQMEHRRRIGSMPRSNCDPAPAAIDPVSGTGQRTFHDVDTAHQFVGSFRCRHRVLWPSPLGLWKGYLLRGGYHISRSGFSLYCACAPLRANSASLRLRIADARHRCLVEWYDKPDNGPTHWIVFQLDAAVMGLDKRPANGQSQAQAIG